MIYVGETRARALRARLVATGIGVCVVRGRVGKANVGAWGRWFYENGAFTDFRAGVPFDDSAFLADVLAMLDVAPRPDFVTLPDVVAGGLDSLRLSMSWLYRVGRLSLRWALVVQDGMRPEDLPWEAPWHVLFVGGSTEWKLATMATWARAAHDHGRTCHVGRVSSAERLRRAMTADVDSGDSAAPLWGERNLAPFLRALGGPVQTGWNVDAW